MKVKFWGLAACLAGSWLGLQSIAQALPTDMRMEEPLSEAVPPLPTPVATVTPIEGTVSVTLVNQTYTNVAYTLLGSDRERTLAGRSQITLANVSTPLDLNFYRPDRGFLIVNVKTTAPGQLQLILTETADMGQGKTVLNISQNGNVYLN